MRGEGPDDEPTVRSLLRDRALPVRRSPVPAVATRSEARTARIPCGCSPRLWARVGTDSPLDTPAGPLRARTRVAAGGRLDRLDDAPAPPAPSRQPPRGGSQGGLNAMLAAFAHVPVATAPSGAAQGAPHPNPTAAPPREARAPAPPPATPAPPQAALRPGGRLAWGATAGGCTEGKRSRGDAEP